MTREQLAWLVVMLKNTASDGIPYTFATGLTDKQKDAVQRFAAWAIKEASAR